MKNRSDLVKTAIIVTVMALLLPVPAAYSADWQGRVNGYLIQCTVTDIENLLFGAWTAFNLQYTFCNENYWRLRCKAPIPDVIDDVDFGCSWEAGPTTQACNGATYSMSMIKKNFSLKAGTKNAQNYVCGEQFKLMSVTVTPLK